MDLFIFSCLPGSGILDLSLKKITLKRAIGFALTFVFDLLNPKIF